MQHERPSRSPLPSRDEMRGAVGKSVERRTFKAGVIDAKLSVD
jgi:hypothetical protein